MKKYVASVSMGKDSLCMLLLILKDLERWPLDTVIFYNTGMEFDCILRLRDRIKTLLGEKGIPFVELFPDVPFLEKMLFMEIESKEGDIYYGYEWCGGPCRWATCDKVTSCKRYMRECFRNCEEVYEYIGIAADEPGRIKDDPHVIYPLVEYGMTEAACLEYCYQNGYSWQEDGVELYAILDRVSCYCCGNNNLKELRNMYRFLPRYWKRLKGLQSRIKRPFHNSGSIFELEKRFRMESDLWYTIYEVVFESGEHEQFGYFGRLSEREINSIERENEDMIREIVVLNSAFRVITRVQRDAFSSL